MNDFQLSLESRFEGCLLGLAVGDALGAPFEGQLPDAIARQHQSVIDLIDNRPAGALRYTDDTQMAIGVASSLVSCRRINERELCKRFAENYSRERGYGPGANVILAAMVQGHDHKRLAATYWPGGSYGNGAAMRAAPVGLMFQHNYQQLWKQARLSALPTHVHRLGIEGAQLLALAVGMAATTDKFVPEAFFANLSHRCESQEYRDLLGKAAVLADVDQLGLLGNGVTATASVVTAIASFALAPDSYEDAVGNAILLGGDTDTIAAMAGAISGAYLGHAAIPNHLLDNLEDQAQGKTYLEDLASRLALLTRSWSQIDREAAALGTP